MVVVTKQELCSLGSASYAAADKSILGPYMQYYWTWALRFIPMRCHPNVVTYTGFLWLLSAVVAVAYYDFGYTYGGGSHSTAEAAAVSQTSSTHAPAWVWLWSAIAIFMYQTFDALDGKQARRIKAGSSVGEIVDHSADAVTTIFVQYLLTSAIFRDETARGFTLSMMVFAGFFVSHWEHYVTHLFYLGYVNAPTEGLLMSAGLFGLTGFFGPQLWADPSFFPFQRIDIAAPAALQPYLPGGLQRLVIGKNADVIFYLNFVMAFVTVVPSIFTTAYTVVQKSRNMVASPIRRSPPVHAPVRVYEALARTALPFFYLCAVACDYVYEFGAFHKGNYFLPELSLGWVASLAATRVTVRRLTGAPYGFCTLSYFFTFAGFILPLLALKGLRVFGSGLSEADLTEATSTSVVALVASQPIASVLKAFTASPYDFVAAVFLSKELQWFNNDANQRMMWIAIGAVGCYEYVHYCWRLLWLMARHLGINLLVLTDKQLAYVDELEAQMAAEKEEAKKQK